MRQLGNTTGFLLTLLIGSFLCSGAWAEGSTTASPALSPQEASRAIQVLEDPQSRADVLTVLKAMAKEGSNGSAPANASEAVPAPEKPQDLEPVKTVVPLEEDGLIARSLRQFGGWLDGMRDQLWSFEKGLRQAPSWSRGIFADEIHSQRFWQALFGLLLVFGIATAVEGIGQRVLRKPRELLCRESEKAEAGFKAAQRERTDAESDAAEPPTAAAPSDDNVALVQTFENGVESVQALALNTALDQPDGEGPGASQRAAQKGAKPSNGQHLSTLRRLPFVLGVLLLKLLPLVLFFAGAALALRWFSAEDPQVKKILYLFINAYLTVRVVVAVIRLLLDPARRGGLNLIRSSRRLEGPLLYWARFVAIFSIFGIALAEAMPLLGAGDDGRMLTLKVVSLLVHLFVVRLIWRIRRPVGDLIKAPRGAQGLWSRMRDWMARAWAVFATVAVLGAWLVWAFRVQDGLSKLLDFLGVTIGILAASRVLWILSVGALDRLLQGRGEAEKSSALQQFYPLAKLLIGLTLAMATLLSLFQAWGFHVLSWFAPGSFGRSLATAATNILVAVVVALVVWQWANAVAHRRLAAWHDHGELMRAARLRTLLPMLRTGLFIIVVLTVLLTVLNQVGVNTAPLLASASIIGVALGFGSQKLVQDFITGIFLLMENAMQVGDSVTVAGVTGTVETLSIRTVRLRASDGSLHIVPFSSVSSVNNTNRGIGNAAIRVGVSYDTDLALAIKELKKIGTDLRQDPAFRGLVLNEMEVWGVDAMDGATITLAGQIRCIDKGRWGVQREVNRRIVERFRELGIRIADPRARIMLSEKDA